MKSKYIFFGSLLSLSIPLSALAVSSPVVDTIPNTVDANSYTLTIFVDEGSTVQVVGGPSQLAPVTDGQGMDPVEDGKIEITVGLAQNAVNVFSITAELNGDISSTALVEINESAPDGGTKSPIPDTPELNNIPEFVDAIEYIITGFSQPDMNIYARTTLGDAISSTKADSEGFFQVTVPLTKNKTNRFNISAEDSAGNESSAIQAVIRHSVDLPDIDSEDVDLYTSAQIFFGDTEGHWAISYINQLYQEGVVSGKSDGIFAPNGLITRAELTKIAMLAFGYSVNTSVDEHPFQDVPKNSWFAPYIEEALRVNVITGYPSGGFGPNDFITRAAALKIVLSAAGFDKTEPQTIFTDVPANEWYAGFVTFASQNGIVAGYPDGSFGPGNNITRAEVAKIVVKVLELKQADDDVKKKAI